MTTARDLLRKARKAAILLGSKNGRRGLAHGVAMTIEHIPALKTLAPEIIIDVGANKGQFSLLCRQLFPAARVIAFEPLNGPATKFAEVFHGDPFVVLHQSAIGKTRNMQTIHISGKEDSSSLLPISAAQIEAFPGTEAVGTESIKVAPLPDFLDEETIGKNALLKVDVQGFELEVLEACGPLLPRFNYCYVECSYRELYEGQALASEVIGALKDAGFELSGVFGQYHDKDCKAVQADFLFERQ